MYHKTIKKSHLDTASIEKDGNIEKIAVFDDRVQGTLLLILEELKKINVQLSLLTDEEIIKQDLD